MTGIKRAQFGIVGINTGFHAAHHNLKGPPLASLKKETAGAASPVSIRFGDRHHLALVRTAPDRAGSLCTR
jgi:hypothetical protein